MPFGTGTAYRGLHLTRDGAGDADKPPAFLVPMKPNPFWDKGLRMPTRAGAV